MLLHVRRCIGWKVGNIKPTPFEDSKLDTKGKESCSVMRSYLVWRRSSMLLSLPCMLYSAIAGFINVAVYEEMRATGVFEPYTDASYFLMLIVPCFAGAVLFLSAIVGLVRWHKWQTTTRGLKIGWLVSTLLPFIPGLLPFDFAIKDEYKTEHSHDEWQASRTIMASVYMIQMIPVVITLPSGVIRGSIRVRGLIPNTSLPGWIIMIAVPLQSLITFFVFVIIIQLAGSIFLILAAPLSVITPWLYVLRSELYTGVTTIDKEKMMDRNDKIMQFMNNISMILVITWAGTADITDINVNMFTVGSALIQSVGRLLITTVVMSDTVLCMTVANCLQDQACREDEDASMHMTNLFRSLQNSINQKTTNVEADTNMGSEIHDLESPSSNETAESSQLQDPIYVVDPLQCDQTKTVPTSDEKA